ncbi:MAG: carboxymuconolactone decarboxylase family protein [Acidimicrobiia bacterium]
MSQAEYQLSLPARTETDDDPAISAMLAKAKAAVGMIPNMYANMVNVPALLDTYLLGYSAFRTESGFNPIEQEIVFLVISQSNGCTYCVAAHSMLADMVKTPGPIVEAVRSGSPLGDAKLDALATFTRVMTQSRGLPSRAEAEAFLAAGYTELQILQIVLALAVKTISNYSNHLFHTPLDPGFAPRAWNG